MTFNRMTLIIASLFLAEAVPAGQTLSNLALYNRCYAQLTGLRPSVTATPTQQVINGQLSPITACMNVLNKAVLSGGSGTTIANTADVEAKAVLRTMHGLHSSWFTGKDFEVVSIDYSAFGSRAMLDTTTPAMYITRALLSPTPSYKSVLQGTTLLGAVRTDQYPTTGAYENNAKTDFAFTSTFNLAPRGELLGIQPITESTVVGNIAYQTPGTVYVSKSWGGGVLGNNVYVTLSAKVNTDFKADGALRMPRRWGRAVYHDLLCRDLPVVRDGDADSFIVAGAEAPFRQSSSCIYCHASMDRTAAVVRGLKAFAVSEYSGGQKRGIDAVDMLPVTQSEETAWPASGDKDYANRPTNGVLFFRNYLGTLISQNVTGLGDLGTAIQNQDDYYLCAAKRYYEYFTGIKVNVGDVGDPKAAPLSTADQSHRNIVISLGKNLRQHDNLRMLINEIMNLPNYKDASFGLK